MYPRLKLARNLLSDDGIIFISMNSSEIGNLRSICTEIFGENNYIAELVWTKKEKASGVPPKNMLIPNFEFILALRKLAPISFRGQERSLASYKQDETGRWWRTMPIQATGEQDSHFTITDPQTGREFYGNWAFSQTRIEEMVLEGKIHFPRNSDGKPVQIVYADEIKNDRSATFANLGKYDSETSTKSLIRLMGGRKVFDFPKPLGLIQFLVYQTTENDDLILDFFAGSGTTAHAVMQLNAEDGGNRRCISVQLPEPTPLNSPAREAGFDTISQITRERIRRAGDKILSDQATQLATRSTPLDVGFRAYRLSDTHFRKWALNSDTSAEELDAQLTLAYKSAEDTSTPEQLFIEVALKHGLSLTESYEITTIAGLEMFSIEEGLILGYFNEHTMPTLDQLREVIDTHPGQLFILEDVFAGNDELKANLAQLCSSRGVELVIA